MCQRRELYHARTNHTLDVPETWWFCLETGPNDNLYHLYISLWHFSNYIFWFSPKNHFHYILKNIHLENPV